MEDDCWETVLPEPPAVAAPPVHDQTFLRWIMGAGDVDDDPSAAVCLSGQQNHQQQQFMSLATPELGGGTGGFGVVDPAFGFETTFGAAAGGRTDASQPVSPSVASSAGDASVGGFPVVNSNCGANSSNRVLPIPLDASGIPSTRIPYFGFSSSSTSSIPLPLSLPPGILFQESAMEENIHLCNSNVLLNQQQAQPLQNPQEQQFLLVPPPPPLPPLKRRHSTVDGCSLVTSRSTSSNLKQDLSFTWHQQRQQRVSTRSPQPRQMKPKLPGYEATPAAMAQQQQQTLVDQLLEAAELVETGNLFNAHEILARLNHHLSATGKPLIRSAFYCKEVLQSIITNHTTPLLSPPPPLQRNASLTSLTSPLDVVLKLHAYKAFSDVSPILQFANFTCTQALLEELNGFDRIHVLDFDIGVGGHWPSFMQELAQRRCCATATASASPSLRITAFVSSSSHHPFELALTRENLSLFANELNIPFEFNILSIDTFDSAGLLSISQGGEAIAVNLPAAQSAYPSVPLLLRLVKQLAPRIVVSVEYGYDNSDFTFSLHCLHVLQSTAVLLDSIDATGSSLEVTNKIERYLLQPRIESSIVGRHRAAEKSLPWWSLFASAGFASVSFSNFTETQAECLLKRVQIRGFHVEQRQASLLLCWQSVGLVSVSAWRC